MDVTLFCLILTLEVPLWLTTYNFCLLGTLDVSSRGQEGAVLLTAVPPHTVLGTRYMLDRVGEVLGSGMCPARLGPSPAPASQLSSAVPAVLGAEELRN